MRVKTVVVTVCAMTFAAELHAADKVRIGVSNYNISNLTVGVAQTRGLFKQEGIDAEIIRMNPNVATMALVSADVDYSTLIGSTIIANLKGARIKMIACSLDRTPLSLVSRAEIKSVREVKGKTIGVGSYGSTPDIIARMVVKHHGIDPETEIKLLALGFRRGAFDRPQGRHHRRDDRRAAGGFRSQTDGLQHHWPRRRYFPFSLQWPGRRYEKARRAAR